MEDVNVREWVVGEPPDAALPAARWTFAGDARALVTAERGSDLFRMPGIRVIDRVGMLGRETQGDFTVAARVAVEGAAFADAAGILVRAGDAWLKACVERTKNGSWTIVTVASCPSSDESYGACVGRPEASLMITRQARRIAVFWRESARADDPAPWYFVRTLTWESTAPVRVGLFAQAPFSQSVGATFDEVRWSSEALPDRR